MKAIVYIKKASPEKLVCREIQRPEPKDNEVLVKICAVSPNAADYRSIKMGIVPKKKILGSGISGIVESVGEKITEFKPGDGVIGDLSDFGFGGFAEFAVTPEQALIHKPKDLNYDVASTLPVAATTALQALRINGMIQKDQKLLVIGSSGGVGTFTVQLAHYFGAEVTAVCSTRNMQQSAELGADHVIDYTKEDFLKNGTLYDYIIAINGNYSLLSCKRILNQNGTYVMVGGALSQIIKSLLFGWLLSFGSKKMRSLSAKSNQSDLEFVAKLVAEGAIKPVIENHFSIDETADAMNYLGSGHAKGKVVINVK